MRAKQKAKVVFSILLSFTILFSLLVINVYAGPTLTSNATGNFDGYDYEYWKDNGTGTMTLNGGGTFSCSWSNINNILFRTGKKLGSTKTYQDYGNIVIDYACNYQPNGNSYMSVYGWTESPLVEYYIIESYGTWKPPGNHPVKGTISVDGGSYEIYETTRTNQPSIQGTKTFQQYWSVRTSKKTSGKISVHEHFKAWEAKGMKMGKLYEVSMVVEGYQSSGKADMTKMNLTLGGSGGPTNPPQNTTPPGPTTPPSQKSAFTRMEAENFDSMSSSTLENIGNGVGYIESGDSIMFGNVNFGSGASSFTATVANGNSSPSNIEIRTGSASGTLAGTLSVRGTGDWDAYEEMSTTVSGLSGVKDLYLKFTGPVNFDNFVFSTGGGSNTPPPNTNPPNTNPPVQGSLGDINADNNVDSTDYALLKRHILGTSSLTGKALQNADTNGDGDANSTDYALIKKYILGLITVFPGQSAVTTRPPVTTPPSVTTPPGGQIKVTAPPLSNFQSTSKLPDPFKFFDGTRMTKKDQWALRRAELSALLQKYEYGEMPDKPDSVKGSFSSNKITVTVTDGGKSVNFSCSIQYPSTGKAPYPAIIGINMNTLNTSEILKLGVALITFPADSIGAESGMNTRGQGKFYDLYGRNHSAGSLMAWAWGVDRLIDALETTPEARIDATKLGVTGGSRNGKGAFAAGAFNERIALTIPQESGNGGTSGWRTADDEKRSRNVQTLSHIIGEQPWFGKALDQFSGKTNSLPHDHHELVALCAPRGLMIFENQDMEWLGKQSCLDIASSGRLIYEALGVKDHMGYSSIGGHQHCQFPSGQIPELQAYIKKFLLGDNSANTNVFRATGTFDKSKWVDWTVPTLQ